MPSVSINPTLESKHRTVIVADPRRFIRGCLACWLDGFDDDFRPVVTEDSVGSVENGVLPVAVMLSASARPLGLAWLEQQIAGVRFAIPALPIVIILDETDLETGQETALTLGAQGFIPMSTSLEIAVAALRLVIAGGCYFPHIAAAVRTPPSSNTGATPPRLPGKTSLTPRENAVLHLLCEGLPNKLIARKLGMALSTVKIHVHHIIEKLQVQNRTEAAVWQHVFSASIGVEAAEQPLPQQIVVHRRA
jgi:two-component system, NarL family, nitrate/nitrite response regulator NarL